MALTAALSSSGYSVGGIQPGPMASGSDEGDERPGFWPLSKYRKAYSTYLDSKTLEIQEQQQARRYRHGAQWTAEQIKTLNDRKQPVVTYNRIGRKIDGIVGLVDRLRQDPKAYPRTPQNQGGADLATAMLRYLMDSNKWNEKTPVISENAAIDGLAGIEMNLKQRQSRNQLPQQQPGQPPDMDVIFGIVDNDGFFYDPRSVKPDFSDATYMGVGKWIDQDVLISLMPQYADKIKEGDYSGADLTSNSDRDNRWMRDGTRDFKEVRLVDIWFKSGRVWNYCLFTGANKLMEDTSPFFNEYDESQCKYIMFSSAIDHDGDRYGFPRNLMSAQDEINQRRSKALHELNNRRIRATKAAVADNNVEALRREGARSDGIILSHTSIDEIQFDDQAKQAAVMGQLEMLREAKSEIENFGPNPALVGQGAGGVGGSSGRAINLLQQAGIAELGPYMTQLRSWKIRVYTALFNAATKYWTAERWIRVTDKNGQPQFVGLNRIQMDQQTGLPQMVNPVGDLDVDIILDEGPDTITIMQDTYDAIAQALPAIAPMLSPDAAKAVMEVLIETSPLPADVKKKFTDAAAQAQQQPSPEQQKQQADMQMKQAELQMTQQKNKDQLQLEAAKAVQQGKLKQFEAMTDAQLAREKAALDAELAQFKAIADAQTKRAQALAGPQLHIPQ